MNIFFEGQLLKNAPEDNFPYFEIVSITTLETTGTVFYRVRSLYDSELELVLHEEDLYPYVNEEVKIVNENVEVFEEGKTYMFLADKIQQRDVHKWSEYVNKQIVDVRLQGLGIVTMIKNGFKREMSVFPSLCVEIEGRKFIDIEEVFAERAADKNRRALSGDDLFKEAIKELEAYRGL